MDQTIDPDQIEWRSKAHPAKRLRLAHVNVSYVLETNDDGDPVPFEDTIHVTDLGLFLAENEPVGRAVPAPELPDRAGHPILGGES